MKLIEQELNVLSSSEIRVALLPVGHVPTDVLQGYEALVQKYCHVRLSTVRSFHHEKQKSPFKQLPWNKGCLNFRFLTGSTLTPSSLSCLYASRAVLGVIGLCHCPTSPDIPKTYTEFENICKQFPNSVTVRCFAFDPVNEEMSQNGRQNEHLIMFPKCDPEQLEHHVEVLMHDFAACLLMELQQGMLNLSANMMTLSTIVDKPDDFGYAGTTDDVIRRHGTEEEVRHKRRHARMQKLFGDWSMLAGSPRDAYEHYSTCVELSRFCGDVLWGAAAVEGMAEAKVIEALIECDSIPKRDPLDGEGVSMSLNGPNSSSHSPSSVESMNSHAFDQCGIGYGGYRMWKTVRHTPDLQDQVLAFYNEAENVFARRGVLPLQIEAMMKTVRVLIVFQGLKAKDRINAVLTRVLEQWPKLKSEYDRMSIVLEVAKILKTVGLHRKRAFLIWQALDSIHLMQTSDVSLISLALKSEVCSDMSELQRSIRYLTKDVIARPSCTILHKAITEAILPTASKAGLEIIVWESAATLLRDFHSMITQERQQMLMDVLKRSSAQISGPDKIRNSLGPPPFFQVRNVCQLPDHLRPQICDDLLEKVPSKESDSSECAFIFNPYAAKRKTEARNEQQVMSRWVVGEECSLEVYISNPCSVQLKIERLSLWIEDDPHTQTPRANPISVSVLLPPKLKPTRVSLTVIPNAPGPLRVIGCNATLYGITWMQRFVSSLRRVPRLPGVCTVEPEWGTESNMVVQMDVVASMPLLKWQFLRSESNQTWPTTIDVPARETGSMQQEKEKTFTMNVRAGQRLDFKLRLTNVSQYPVLRAKLMSECKEKPSMQQELLNGSAMLCVEADDQQLQQKLPIFSNDVNELPVRVHVGHKAAVTGISNNKDIPVKIRMLYSGPQSDCLSSGVVFGRELSAPLSFRILPSANIIAVQISQHYVPVTSSNTPPIKSFSKHIRSSSHADNNGLDASLHSTTSSRELRWSSEGAAADDLPSNLHRRTSSLKERSDDSRKREESIAKIGSESDIYRFNCDCVIHVTIANHDTQVLCVWVGETLKTSSFEQQQWTPPAAPASHSVVPGQAVQVSCRIPLMPSEEMDGESIEVMASNWIRSSLSGYWQSVAHQPTFMTHDESPSYDSTFTLNPSYGSQGTIPIRRDLITKAFNSTLLASFIQAYITLSVQLAEPFSKGFVNLRDILEANADLAKLMDPNALAKKDDEWTTPEDFEAPTRSQGHSPFQLYTNDAADSSTAPKRLTFKGTSGPNGEIWGIQTEVGEFLNCEIVVENKTRSSLDDVSITVCSERLDEAPESSDVLFRSEGGLNDAGILLIGRVSNIPLSLSSGATFKHRFGLCCVMPGLYQIYACEKVPESHGPEAFVQRFRLNIACK